jgi:hypothetical protein
MSASRRDPENFVDLAEQQSPGLLREFVRFLGERKKWWLAPIVALLLLLGVVILLGGTGAAPFIYTLF